MSVLHATGAYSGTCLPGGAAGTMADPASPGARDGFWYLVRGKNACGKQRYLCKDCGRSYVLEPKPRGHGPKLKEAALRMYADGLNFRRIARFLGARAV